MSTETEQIIKLYKLCKIQAFIQAVLLMSVFEKRLSFQML